MKAAVAVDPEYSNCLLVELSAEGDIECLLFDFLKFATVEKNEDSGVLTIHLRETEQP
jgi:hypothetical protein